MAPKNSQVEYEFIGKDQVSVPIDKIYSKFTKLFSILQKSSGSDAINKLNKEFLKLKANSNNLNLDFRSVNTKKGVSQILTLAKAESKLEQETKRVNKELAIQAKNLTFLGSEDFFKLPKQSQKELKKAFLENPFLPFDKSLIASKKSLFDFSRAMGALSFLFAAQGIERSLVRLATISIQSFSKIAGSTSPASRALIALGANFEYLKFTIGEAIANQLLPLLPFLLQGIEGLANLLQDNPWLIWAGGIVLVSAYIIGFLANLILLGAGLKMLTGFDVLKWLKTFSIGTITNIKNAFKKLGETISTIFSKDSLEKFTNFMNKEVIDAIKNMGTKFSALQLGLIAFGWLAGIFAFVYVMNLLTQKTGSIGNAFKELGFAILQIFAGIGDFIVTILITPFQLLLAAWENFISAIDKKHVTPKWVQDFTSWKPTMGQAVSEKWFDFQAGYKQENLNKNNKEKANTDAAMVTTSKELNDTLSQQNTNYNDLQPLLSKQIKLEDNSTINKEKLNTLIKTYNDSLTKSDTLISKDLNNSKLITEQKNKEAAARERNARAIESENKAKEGKSDNKNNNTDPNSRTGPNGNTGSKGPND